MHCGLFSWNRRWFWFIGGGCSYKSSGTLDVRSEQRRSPSNLELEFQHFEDNFKGEDQTKKKLYKMIHFSSWILVLVTGLGGALPRMEDKDGCRLERLPPSDSFFSFDFRRNEGDFLLKEANDISLTDKDKRDWIDEVWVCKIKQYLLLII